MDHGLTDAQLEHLLERFADRAGFLIETVELPAELGLTRCALYGPAMGDAPVAEADVLYARRAGRAGDSRMVRRHQRPTALVTVVAGPHDGQPCVLYTAYPGPAAPREPWDPGLDDAGRAEAEAFWAQHALSTDLLG